MIDRSAAGRPTLPPIRIAAAGQPRRVEPAVGDRPAGVLPGVGDRVEEEGGPADHTRCAHIKRRRRGDSLGRAGA